MKSILEKIQKLLSLATSSNEHEAKLAASKAQELLIRHNLTMSQVEKHISDYERSTIWTKGYEPKEYLFVCHILRQHFFVETISIKGRAEFKLDFIGTKENVEIARYVSEFLARKFRELWRVYKKENGLHEKFAKAYMNGLCDGFCQTLEESKKKVETEMGLIVVEDANLKRAVHTLCPALRLKTSRIRMDAGTYRDGIEQGKNIRLAKSISSKSSDFGGQLT